MKAGGYTFVLCGNGEVHTDTRRGIRPLLELLEKPGSWRGHSAADKAVGKAAAFLYLRMRVDSVYAGTVNRSAARVLQEGGAKLEYGQTVPAIRNREDTGFCPLESAVQEIPDSKEAVALLRKILSQ